VLTAKHIVTFLEQQTTNGIALAVGKTHHTVRPSPPVVASFDVPCV